jgi:hypothetical protein
MSTLTTPAGDEDKEEEEDEEEEEEELDAALMMWKSDHIVPQDVTAQQASRWREAMHIFKLLFDLLGASLQ